MEYYSGILFLTTNKVGTLDEAFRSRVYLSLNDTPEILQSNLRRLLRTRIAIDKSSNGGYIKVMHGRIKKFVEAKYKQYSKAKKK